jgi:hypothetical protein
MFGQEPCTGHCTSVNNACNVGKYSFTYHPTDDTMTIQYAGYNSITVSAIVASGNNHEDTYYGFITVAWDANQLPLHQKDVFSAMMFKIPADHNA